MVSFQRNKCNKRNKRNKRNKCNKRNKRNKCNKRNMGCYGCYDCYDCYGVRFGWCSEGLSKRRRRLHSAVSRLKKMAKNYTIIFRSIDFTRVFGRRETNGKQNCLNEDFRAQKPLSVAFFAAFSSFRGYHRCIQGFVVALHCLFLFVFVRESKKSIIFHTFDFSRISGIENKIRHKTA
jgi:hypothetical protein